MEIEVHSIHSCTEACLRDDHISIVMINSRENILPKFTTRARDSAFAQLPTGNALDLIEVRNHERRHSIGACWNEAVRIAAPGTITFLGDDDYLSPEFIYFMLGFRAAILRHGVDESRLAGVSCFLRPVDEWLEVIDNAYLPLAHTGMYKRDLLLKNPFDESRENNVDTEFVDRLQCKGYTIPTCEHYFGYYYTIHADMVSGWDRFIKGTNQTGSKQKLRSR